MTDKEIKEQMKNIVRAALKKNSEKRKDYPWQERPYWESQVEDITTALFAAGYRPQSEVRVETAKEFAEKANNAIDNKKYKAGFSANMLWAIDAKNCINEIAEQFGAEVEE